MQIPGGTKAYKADGKTQAHANCREQMQNEAKSRRGTLGFVTRHRNEKAMVEN